jgi:exosortase
VRDAGFLLLLVLSVAWCWQPLMTVISRSLGSGEYEHYSHIILLPFVAAYLLHLKRDAIFEHVRPAFLTGLLATAAATTAIWLGQTSTITGGPQEGLALTILGLVMLWAGGFVLCYGLRAFRRAAFPFALLVFMVPLPPVVLSSVIVFLQTASADVSELLFGLIRMPTFRDGFTFALPGLTIQIAQGAAASGRACLY